MSELDMTIQLFQARRNREIPPDSARFQLTMTRLLAQGKPVSVQQLAKELDAPAEFVSTAFQQLRQGGCEFNDRGELIGAALTLTPTRHQFRVENVQMYAWCALDTLFLPAYIGKPAYVTSRCPVTGESISLTVTPKSVEAVAPPGTVLSILTAENCTSGIEGTFCGQIHFFASRDAARRWVDERSDFAILTVAEAFRLARVIYIEPVMKHA